MADINMAMNIINASFGEYDIYELRFYLNGTINGLSLEFLYSYLEIKDDYNEDWEDWEE